MTVADAFPTGWPWIMRIMWSGLRQIECPMLNLWAEGGPLDTFYAKDGSPLGIWRQWAPHAQGQAMKSGHFFPEENPDDASSSRFASAVFLPRRNLVNRIASSKTWRGAW